jgi:type I restriction enzyme S subunit
MRDGWVETPIGDVAQVLSGFAFKSELFNKSEGIPLIRIRDLPKRESTEALYSGSYEDRYVVKKGDFLIGMDGEFHCYEWNGPDALLNQRVCRIQDFKIGRVVPRYIYFAVNQYLDKIEQDTGYTTVKHISAKQVLGITIPLPPLPEQKRIVDLVSSVDSYIEALQQQLESAKRSRNAVLHELLTAGGDDWVETTLGEVAEVIGGGTPSTRIGEYWEGDIVWLTPTEITSQDGKVVSDSIRKITDLGFRNSGAQMLPKDSVILTSRASVGFVALAGKELCTNQGFQSLIPKPSVLSKFLMFWIQLNRPEFESRSAGSTFKEISKSNVKSIKLELPPLPEQKRIVEIVNTIDEVISQTELTTSKAQNLRSGLMSDLLSGEHEIPVSYDKVMDVA